ncbi:unnamed protein product [Caenorhabditis angaria]|uniref:Uncharacterized protein n=1 Tax=Caenorhabditis angaria TaxID=860376 RepID=A0A9P1IZ16_9PELO|nr:unnamed protein product [Caenorhabditis angaria]
MFCLPVKEGVTAAIIIGFLTESLTILSQLNEYRETLYIIFGIVCLVSWLCFNLWALREFFCPAIFGRRPNPSEDRLAFIKLKYVSSGKFLINLTNQNRREEIEMNNLQIFVV